MNQLASSPLTRECATACLQAVLFLLGGRTACKQAVARILDELAIFSGLPEAPSADPATTLGSRVRQ